MVTGSIRNEATAIAVAARPRTLVLVLSAETIEAVVLGPSGATLGPPVLVERGPEPRPSFEGMWPQLEAVGEFDRISVLTRPGIGAAWTPSIITEELERQSLRRVRLSTVGELEWSRVIRGSGVELVVALGTELDSSLFLDGVPVPGLAIGQHVFRKQRSYQEYLAPRVLERKGQRAWNKRVARAVTEILAVWNPTMLYIAVGPDVALELDLGPSVAIVTRPTGLESALALWKPPLT